MAERQMMHPSTVATTARTAPISSALGCVVLIGRMHGLHLSAERLAAAGGLVGGEPDQTILATCAASAGFRCKALKLDWRHLGELDRALPAIVRMRGGRSVVLSRIDDRGDVPQVTLHDPSAEGDEPLVLLRAAFEAAWTGDILLLKRTLPTAEAEHPFGWATIFGMVRGQGRLLRDLLLSTVILALLALAPILFAQALVSDVPDLQARATFVFLSCGIVIAVLFEAAFAAVRQGLVTRLSTRVRLQLDTLLFDRLLRMPIGTVETTPAGLMAHRLDRVAALEAMLAGPLTRGLLDVGVVLVFIPAMLVTSLALTLAALALLAVAAGLALLLDRRLRRAAAALDAADAAADVLLSQTLSSFSAITSLALAGRQRRRWDVLTARATRLRLAAADAAGSFDMVARALERLVVFGPFALGVAFTVTGVHDVSRAALFGFLLFTWRIAAPLRDLPALLQGWNAGRAALADLRDLADAVPEAPRGRAGALTPLAGHIVFSGVQFSYPDAPVPALRSLSFEVRAGSTLGIMGRSGAGKSTVARLLQRLHADYQGLIKIDGIDVREFDIDHLRASLGVVGQDSVLFPGTIRENLAIGQPGATEEEIAHALRLVGAEAFVDRLPLGLGTVLGETARSLSDGERQRLAIARALIAAPAVLVLDEATSALDPESEAVITSNLQRIAAGRTLIVISQRLAALMHADAILVMDRGEVQDIGRHHDLIERSDLYSGLWRRQTAQLDRPVPPPSRLSRGTHVA